MALLQCLMRRGIGTDHQCGNRFEALDGVQSIKEFKTVSTWKVIIQAAIITRAASIVCFRKFGMTLKWFHM